MLTPSKNLIRMDLAPVAILKLEADDLASRYPDCVQDDTDNLDHRRGVFFHLDKTVPLALLRHDGDPQDTMTLYVSLPDSGKAPAVLAGIVNSVVRHLGLTPDSILWQSRTT